MLRNPTACALLGLTLFSCHPAGGPETASTPPPVPAPPAAAPPVAKASKSPIRRNTGSPSLQDILAQTEASVLTHPIDPRAHNVLNGWHGTTVTLPPNSLVLEDGSEPRGPVIITLKEYYTPAEMIGAHISTTSFERLLETAGTILIEARAAAGACTLRPGMLADIEFPYEEKLPGMQLFTRSREGGRLNWNAIYDLKSGNRFFRTAPGPAAHRVGIGYYSFHCPTLGLISCSRFVEESREKASLLLDSGPMDEGSAQLLFQSTNSLVEAARNGNSFRFDDLPQHEPAIVVCSKRSGGKLFLSVKWGITGDPALQKPAFVAVSAQELQQRLKALARNPAPTQKSLALLKARFSPTYL
jgi:hypothetical protein